MIYPYHGNLEVTLEMGDNYLSAEISIPCGVTLVKGRITSRKRDKDGNVARIECPKGY
jgi:hypothetical protein